MPEQSAGIPLYPLRPPQETHSPPPHQFSANESDRGACYWQKYLHPQLLGVLPRSIA